MMFQQIDYDIDHWAWYMGLTSMCRFTYGICYVFWRWLVTIENYDVSTNWLWYWSLSLVYGSYEHVPFHIRNLLRFLAVAGYYRKWWCFNKLIMIFIIELGIWVLRACDVFVRGLLPFLAVAGYYRKWWCFNTLIMIFIIELGIWVLRACPVSHTESVTFFGGGWLL